MLSGYVHPMKPCICSKTPKIKFPMVIHNFMNIEDGGAILVLYDSYINTLTDYCLDLAGYRLL